MSTFDYGYYCGSNVRIRIVNRLFQDESNSDDDLSVFGINYSLNYNPQPIYGYCSSSYDAMLKGREMVQGTLLLNTSIGHSILKSILSKGVYTTLKSESKFINYEIMSIADFDIEISIGNVSSATNSNIIIRNCYIISHGRTIQASSDAIVEEYNFFGREIHTSREADKLLKEEQERIKQNEIKKQEELKKQNKASLLKQGNSAAAGLANFYQDLQESSAIKLEQQKTIPQDVLAFNDSSLEEYSINVNKDISLLNNNTAIAYKAPFYAKSKQINTAIPQKVLNANLLNFLLASNSRYGDKKTNNPLFLQDKKALEVLASYFLKDNINKDIKTKQLNNYLWTNINKLNDDYSKITDMVPSSFDVEKEYSKSEAYIEQSGIKRIVSNFFDGNYSNNIGLSNKYFYESASNIPAAIDTSIQDALYTEDMIYYLDTSNYIVSDYIQLNSKKEKYKEYYSSLWGKSPDFIKG